MHDAIPLAEGPLDGTVPGATGRMPPSGLVDVLVVLDEAGRSGIDVVLSRLEGAGLVEVIPRRKLGVVHGAMAEGGLAALDTIPGVATVRHVAAPHDPSLQDTGSGTRSPSERMRASALRRGTPKRRASVPGSGSAA